MLCLCFCCMGAGPCWNNNQYEQQNALRVYAPVINTYPVINYQTYYVPVVVSKIEYVPMVHTSVVQIGWVNWPIVNYGPQFSYYPYGYRVNNY